MNKLMIAFFATMALVSVSGCKKKGGAGGSGEAMAKMQSFSDEMCACKDADCAKKVSDKMTAWSQEQAKNQKEPVKMSEADQKKATEIGTKMGECMQKAMGMGMGGSAAGSAEGSAAAGSAEGSAAGSAEGSAAGSAAAGSAEGSAAAGSAAAGSAAGSAEKKEEKKEEKKK